MNVLERHLKVVDFLDTPEVLDASITPIPGNGSAPLEVVHQLAAPAHLLHVRDGIQTDFIGLYTGGVGQEQLVTLLGGPGSSEVPVFLPKNSRISIRAMGATPLSQGQLTVLFVGFLQ